VFKKIWLVVLGQSFLSSGLLLFAIDHHITKAGTTFRYIASIFYFFGYSLGIGKDTLHPRYIRIHPGTADGARHWDLANQFVLVVLRDRVPMSRSHLQQQRNDSFKLTRNGLRDHILLFLRSKLDRDWCSVHNTKKSTIFNLILQDVRIRTPTKRSRKKSDEKRNSEEN
jgi:hypothetical protein